MSQVVKETSITKWQVKNDSDVLSEEILSRLEIDDDFVWVEGCEDYLENNIETDSEISNLYVAQIAQYDTNSENGAIADQCALKCYEETPYNMTTPLEWERGLSVEQQYWRSGRAARHAPGQQHKHSASQRLTMREHNTIDNNKRRNADPASFKFDFQTTAVLNLLFEQNHAGPYHNIVGKGSNSIVIHAKYPEVPYIRGVFRMNCYYGVAVKVYKLSSDADKNNAIFKRTQREYNNLKLLRFNGYGYVPYVIKAVRNVIVLEFVGEDQETAPSITTVPSEYCKNLYNYIVAHMDNWYKLSLVHGKLSSKNIVVQTHSNSFDGFRYIPHYLGWSHSVRADHPHALMKLLRDCRFVTDFFKKKGIPVKSAEELFKDITKVDEISSEVLDGLEEKYVWPDRLLTNPNRKQQKTN